MAKPNSTPAKPSTPWNNLGDLMRGIRSNLPTMPGETTNYDKQAENYAAGGGGIYRPYGSEDPKKYYDISYLLKYIRPGVSQQELETVRSQALTALDWSQNPQTQREAAEILAKIGGGIKTAEQTQSEQSKQELLNRIKQYGYFPESDSDPVGLHNSYYPGDPRGFTITQDELDEAVNYQQARAQNSANELAKTNADQAKNPATFASQGAREALNHARDVAYVKANEAKSDLNTINIKDGSDPALYAKYGLDPNTANAGDLINAVKGKISVVDNPNFMESTPEAFRIQKINDTVSPSGNSAAQQTQQAQTPVNGITPEALIQQLIDSVGQGQAQQETATKEQFAQAQPALEQALNAALVRQSGGGRGGLDTGGMISAMAQQKQKGTVDLNKALSDVANFYSTLKQNALGQALTGSLNIAQMGQQANQFGQTLAQNNQQNLQQTELQKYLAQLQSQQQNKQLSQTADQFAKSFGLQQQQQGWTQSQAALNRAYELQDWQKQADLSKELAGMQPQTPEWSYWLNPLAQAFGSFAGGTAGNAAIKKLLGG